MAAFVDFIVRRTAAAGFSILEDASIGDNVLGLRETGAYSMPDNAANHCYNSNAELLAKDSPLQLGGVCLGVEFGVETSLCLKPLGECKDGTHDARAVEHIDACHIRRVHLADLIATDGSLAATAPPGFEIGGDAKGLLTITPVVASKTAEKSSSAKEVRKASVNGMHSFQEKRAIAELKLREAALRKPSLRGGTASPHGVAYLRGALTGRHRIRGQHPPQLPAA